MFWGRCWCAWRCSLQTRVEDPEWDVHVVLGSTLSGCVEACFARVNSLRRAPRNENGTWRLELRLDEHQGLDSAVGDRLPRQMRVYGNESCRGHGAASRAPLVPRSARTLGAFRFPVIRHEPQGKRDSSRVTRPLLVAAMLVRLNVEVGSGAHAAGGIARHNLWSA